MPFWIVDYKTTGRGELQPVIIGGRAFSQVEAALDYQSNANLSDRSEIFELNARTPGEASRAIRDKLRSRVK